jgi:hypothetical protein
MSFVSVVPDIVSAAAGSLEGIGSAMSAANAAAAAPTSGLVNMAADEVSAAVTAAFSSHAQQYQALSARASAFYDQFVSTLNSGAGAYVGTEIANAQQNLLNAVNAPVQGLLGGGGPLAAAAQSVSQSFNYPFGPFQLSGSFTSTPGSDGSVFATGSASATLGPLTVLSASGSASVPQNGPVSVGVNGTTPYGPVGLSLGGVSATNGSMHTVQITGGSLQLSPAIGLLAAQYGPTVTGTASLANSTNAVAGALATGDYFGALSAFASTPINYSNAVLFGHTSITFPDQAWATALGLPTLPSVHIPFGGILADPQPITVTIPTYSYEGGTLLGSTFALQGSEFGGFAPLLLRAFGLPF